MGNQTYVPSDKSYITYLKISKAAGALTEFSLTEVVRQQICCDKILMSENITITVLFNVKPFHSHISPKGGVCLPHWMIPKCFAYDTSVVLRN